MSLLTKGVTNFLALTDTPSSYSGQAAKVASVNAGEDALEFIDPPEHAAAGITCVEPQSFRPDVSDTWEDFDLSKVVPEGTTGAVFHLINTDTGQARRFGLRKKGSTQSYVGALKKDVHSWAIVGLDENRKCQGTCESPANNHFLLVGYTGENYTFFTDGYDITPVTTAAWVETDIATECPGAIAAIIEFANPLDAQAMQGARKHGSTDDRHRGNYHMWMVVGVDANQHLDLYDYGGSWPSEAFNLIGYITAGVTMYTNASDISPTQDITYHTVSLGGFLANPIIAFIEIDNTAAAFEYAIRKNVWCADIYRDGDNHNFAIVHPNTPDSTLRVKLSHADFKIFLLGIG